VYVCVGVRGCVGVWGCMRMCGLLASSDDPAAMGVKLFYEVRVVCVDVLVYGGVRAAGLRCLHCCYVGEA